MFYTCCCASYISVHICAIQSLAFLCSFFFFFNDTATTEIYTLSLHDALPISQGRTGFAGGGAGAADPRQTQPRARSEEHTSELQSHSDLVCRLLLEKKKMIRRIESQLIE